VPSALPILGTLALALCGFVGAPAIVGAASVRVPWDAASPGPRSRGAAGLALRPVDPTLRLELARGAPTSVPLASASVLVSSLNRWSRGHASQCLVGAETAWAWWRATNEDSHRRTGDDLLLTFLRRTPGGHVDGVRSWLRNGDPDADPRVVFGSLPAPVAATAGSLVADRDVDAGWDLMLPAVLDTSTPIAEAAGLLDRAVQLAERRRRPEDAAVLRAIASRPGCPDSVKAASERVLGLIEGGR
jgi:hypothetical protein